MREEVQYYFRTCLRIIANEGRENNPALISNTNACLLALPLPQERDLASEPGLSGQKAEPLGHSLGGTEERGGRMGQMHSFHCWAQALWVFRA